MRADTFSFLPLTLNSPNTADHMGSYGPAFYQSYDGAGQFTYDFDGEQLFSVDLKKREAVWRLPEFGNFAYFDPQNGLVSIAMIKAHLEVLVERSNGTRAPNGTGPFPCPGALFTLSPAWAPGVGGWRSLLPWKLHEPLQRLRGGLVQKGAERGKWLPGKQVSLGLASCKIRF